MHFNFIAINMHFSVQKHYIQFALILSKYIISLISKLFLTRNIYAMLISQPIFDQLDIIGIVHLPNKYVCLANYQKSVSFPNPTDRLLTYN